MEWDCIVVGGGAAGLSAALVLGRARRRTLVVDSGAPSNLVAHGIGGFLGQDGRPPADFYAAARDELKKYPTVDVRSGEVVDGEPGFTLRLGDGSAETTETVLLATGMDYRFPDIPGAAERWGGTVFHCPFCHGWEVQGRPLGVLANGPSAAKALLLTAWSDDVTLYTDGPADIADPEGLAAAGVVVDERPVAGLRGAGRDLDSVVLADGSERPCGGLLVTARLHQRTTLARRLGLDIAEPTEMAADALKVGPMASTSVPGVFAAGDVSGTMPSVANSVAAGSVAAAMVVHRLMIG